MNENERDLLKRLAPKPVPPPPEGLLGKLKEEIPERLPANVRPFRRRIPPQALRIAAMLFVAGGALFVVARGIRHRDLEPGAPAAKPAVERPRAVEPAPAPAPPLAARPAPPAPAKTNAAQRFAPEMPAAPQKAVEAPRAAAEKKVQREAPEAAQKADSEQGAPQRTRDTAQPASADEGRLAQNAPMIVPAPAGAASAPPPAARAKSEGYLAGAVRRERATATLHVAPTGGSLLGQVIGHRVGAAAAREGDRVLALLSVAGETGELSGPGQVLSAAALPGGGLVVLVDTGQGAVVTLRSGDESVSAGAPRDASPDVHLAYLAWTLERARASGDAAVRSRVAREAEGLRAVDPRATVLRDLARVP